MNFYTALKRILAHLKQHHKATNTVLTELVEGDSELFNKVKEQLIIDDLAEDIKGAGLSYCCSTSEDHDDLTEADYHCLVGSYPAGLGNLQREVYRSTDHRSFGNRT